VLGATDIAARGVTRRVKLVGARRPAREQQAYMHRSGRTARAGQPATYVPWLVLPNSARTLRHSCAEPVSRSGPQRSPRHRSRLRSGREIAPYRLRPPKPHHVQPPPRPALRATTPFEPRRRARQRRPAAATSGGGGEIAPAPGCHAPSNYCFDCFNRTSLLV